MPRVAGSDRRTIRPSSPNASPAASCSFGSGATPCSAALSTECGTVSSSTKPASAAPMPAPSWRAVVTALVSRPSLPGSSESAAGNSAGLAKPMPKPEIEKPIAIARPLETGIAIASVPAATIEVPTVTIRRSDQSRCVTSPVATVQVRLDTSSGNEAQNTDHPEPACRASVITVVPPVNAMPADSAIRHVA